MKEYICTLGDSEPIYLEEENIRDAREAVADYVAETTGAVLKWNKDWGYYFEDDGMVMVDIAEVA